MLNHVPVCPDEVFAAFTSDDRKKWIGLSKEGKQRIINRFAGAPSRKAHVTEFEHDDDPLPLDTDRNDEEVSHDDATVLTANQAQAGSPSSSADAHPGDMPRVLAQKTEPTKSEKRSGFTATIRHVGNSQLAGYESDSDFSLELGGGKALA